MVSLEHPRLTTPSASALSRLRKLKQPVDSPLSRVTPSSIDISPLQNNPTLHHYDQDVVRELSVPPEYSFSGLRRYPQANVSHLNQHPETSRFLTNPSHHYASLAPSTPRLRTSSTPSLIAHHGLPTSLPPPPRTTFVAPTAPTESFSSASNIIPNTDSLQDPAQLVSFLDSYLRGSYSNMLENKNNDATVSSSASAPELPCGGAPQSKLILR